MRYLNKRRMSNCGVVFLIYKVSNIARGDHPKTLVDINQRGCLARCFNGPNVAAQPSDVIRISTRLGVITTCRIISNKKNKEKKVGN